MSVTEISKAKPDLRDWVNCKYNGVYRVVYYRPQAKPDLRDWVNCKYETLIKSRCSDSAKPTLRDWVNCKPNINQSG